MTLYRVDFVHNLRAPVASMKIMRFWSKVEDFILLNGMSLKLPHFSSVFRIACDLVKFFPLSLNVALFY